jgi:uncharacterized protein
MIVAEILLGAALGFIAGLTGAGGAALALPGLIFLLGTNTVTAVATTFPFTAIMKVFGSYQHIRQGSVHWGVSLDLLIGTVVGTIAGIFLISFLVSTFGDEFNEWLKVGIGIILLISIGLSYFAKRSEAPGGVAGQPGGRNVKGILGGAVAGVVIGGTSVGGGSLLIVLMLFLYRIRPAQIVGTSIVVSLVLMIVGTAGFWREGLADLRLALHLAIGGVPGVIAGSIMTMHVAPKLLGRVVQLAIAVAGVSLAVQGTASLIGR